MKNSIIDFLHDQEGATAIEYGLIAGLIAVVLVTTLTNVGTQLNRIFTLIVTNLGLVGA